MIEQQGNHEKGSRDVLDTIFDQATRRPRPSEQSEERAFAALHAQWQRNLDARRRRSIGRPLALAASLVLAVGIIWVYSGIETTSPNSMVASIARMTGDYATVRTRSADEQSLLNSNGVMDGSVVTTGPATRIALTWAQGGSLRLDEKSTVEVISASKVRLLAGAVYYDSKAGSQMNPDSPALIIETLSGSVRHIGTQFMVQVDNDNAIISVREGKIRFDGSGTSLVVEPGRQISVNTRGMQSQQTIEPHSDTWRWAEEIAPHFQADGQSAARVLDWIARETGRRLIYHEQSRRIAHETVIHGITNVGPDNALDALGVATDLRIDIVEDTIEVEERTH